MSSRWLHPLYFMTIVIIVLELICASVTILDIIDREFITAIVFSLITLVLEFMRIWGWQLINERGI